MSVENPQTFGSQIVAGESVVKCPLEIEEEERHQEHFKTDHLLSDLKAHTISSGVVTMSSQAGKFFLSLVSST
jgi:hypothetical protein